MCVYEFHVCCVSVCVCACLCVCVCVCVDVGVCVCVCAHNVKRLSGGSRGLNRDASIVVSCPAQ